MSDAPGVRWHGKQFMSAMERDMAKKLDRAVTLIYNEVKESISKPGRTIETVATKSGKTRKKYGKKGEFVSAPGEPPRKQSGRLYRSLRKKVYRKGGYARVIDRGRLTEFGTERMEARPHLRPALAKLRSAIAGILSAPVGVALEDWGTTVNPI